MISYPTQLENWAISACKQVGQLPPDLQLRNHDSPDEAEDERLIFMATEGIQNPPDTKCFETELAIELRTISRDALATDAIWAAVEGSFSTPHAQSEAAKLFYGLALDNEESTSNRSDGRDTRSRTRTYKFFVEQF